MMWKKASFTVEAAFIFSIAIWILFSICYLSMYVHDRTVVYSLGQHYLEMALENGADAGEGELKKGLEKYLSEKLLISDIGRVYVKKGLVSVEAEVSLLLTIRVPFVKALLTGQEGKKIDLSHEKLSAPSILWDAEVTKGEEKNENSFATGAGRTNPAD